MKSDIVDVIARGYAFQGESLLLGAPIWEGRVLGEAGVRIPLSMMNRHGLVSGATGTGKTKTLQVLTEQLSVHGVPVFLGDLKGDLSGLAAPGTPNPKVEERARELGIPFQPAGFPVEFLSLTGTGGIPLRATVSSFGPLLFARAFGLNETQQSVLAMIFKLCDDRGLLLLDLADLKAVLQHVSGSGAALLADYGVISKSTLGVLLRKIVEMEQQGADRFFGEPEFEIEDLLRVDGAGRGIVSMLELGDVQDRPALFSTFLMWLLASLYRELPEAGDLSKPKLVFFFDEAHFLFEESSKAFLDQVEQVVRMIRSKGVGVFFVTQAPKDVPAEVLAQLGSRVQHALRAFTPDDERALRAAANTFPRSEHYDIAQTILSLGIGEALVTVLSEQGTPTPVVATRMAPPMSQMSPLPPADREDRVRRSPLYAEYASSVDRVSARESLLTAAGSSSEPANPAVGRGRSAAEGKEETLADSVGKAINSPLGRAVGRELVRGLFGVLGVRPPGRRSRRRTL